MKYLFLASFLSLNTVSNAQLPTQKLSRDSAKYYQRELNKLWRTTFDSLKNSERYKTITGKLDTKNRQKIVRVELLAIVGFYFNDFKNLNARLKLIGQEAIQTMTPSIGASLAVNNPIMTYGLEFLSYAFDNKTATFKGVHGRFFLATNLFKKKRFSLTPQIGFAGSFLNMFINKSSPQTNFNDLFTSQANTIELSHSQTYLDFALGLKFKSPAQENLYWQFLRVGYRYGLKNVNWGIKGGNISNSPIDRNNQFYIQLCLGFDR